jgi:hypothetical protein
MKTSFLLIFSLALLLFFLFTNYKRTPLPGNTEGGSIIVPLTSCLTGLNESVLQIKTKIVSCHTADSKPVKQEVSSTVIIPPLVFPACFYVSIQFTARNFAFAQG